MLRKMISSLVARRSSLVKDLSLCLLSAVLLILSFPTFNLWPLAWIGFVPLFFVLQKKSRGKAFLFSYLTGVIFWSGTIYWLIHVTLPGTIILVAYLALYFALFGLISSYHGIRNTEYGILFIPSFWVILEYLRSYLFTGFPWALLGYSQYLNLPIIQIADICGAWGVSFLVMLGNVAIYSYIVHRTSYIAKQRKYLLSLLVVLVTLFYGYYRINQAQGRRQEAQVRISVVQGNIPQELKWDEDARDFILNKYFTLTELVARDRPDLIIWPEASSPALFGEDNLIFQDIFSLAKKIKTPLLVGTVAQDKDKYFNSALLINGDGRLIGRYDKLHLVPFGEYIPLKNIFPFLETVVPIGDITSGKDYTIFKLPTPNSPALPAGRQLPTKFAVLICFEDLFPELSRQFSKDGAQFLVNITNDAWYKKTSAAHQHLQASVFRAVENRLPLVRSANTGVSAFIAPSGKIKSCVRDKSGREIFIDGYLTEDILIRKQPLSFYSRWGDLFVIICILFVLYIVILVHKKKP